MRNSKHLNNDQIKSWAWKNNIYIISEIINKSQPNPPDLRIIVKYWGFTTRGKEVYSQKKKQHYELSLKINKLYRHYYENYIENKDEIKI
tara:strand:- start:1822 stop:2091 length:270 start_codon:yes stop_codon:yes gene_type:complete